MNMDYPNHETYKALYLKYYSGRDISELLDMLGPLVDTRLLELCGGDGRLSLAAIERGASATLVEESPHMVPQPLYDKMSIRIAPVSVALRGFLFTRKLFDRIVCRQAINYWIDQDTSRLVARVLAPNGIFVFNTFNKKPNEEPQTRQYDYEGHSFAEISWLIGDAVHHVQTRDGMEPHYTKFKWLSPNDFYELLDPHFSLTIKEDGNTSIYCCKKK